MAMLPQLAATVHAPRNSGFAANQRSGKAYITLQDGDGARPEAVHGVPMYVALVDVCGGEDYLELIRSALQAALEAMPAGALFGLITFSTRVRIPRN